VLSFLGAGINPVTPSWGNIMADGRSYFRLRPELIFYPGTPLSLSILSINILGDAVRDTLDPRTLNRSGQR
jgi:peptide/nickel transport system permease protein